MADEWARSVVDAFEQALAGVRAPAEQAPSERPAEPPPGAGSRSTDDQPGWLRGRGSDQDAATRRRRVPHWQAAPPRSGDAEH